MYSIQELYQRMHAKFRPSRTYSPASEKANPDMSALIKAAARQADQYLQRGIHHQPSQAYAGSPRHADPEMIALIKAAARQADNRLQRGMHRHPSRKRLDEILA